MIEESIVQPFFNAEIIDFKLIGSGWHNRLFLINNCHVARLSFTEHGKQKMILYNKVQDSIKLPINTPKYESLKLINDSSLYTALAIYKYFDGSQANFQNLSKSNILLLAQSISEIHKLNFLDLFDNTNILKTLEEEFENLQKYVYPHLLKSEVTFINNLYSKYLKSNITQNVIPKFVHGDITEKNMVLSDGKLTALIDWDGIHYDDPMFDFSRFTINMIDKILSQYPNKEFLGENIFFRYLFYRIRKHTYAMYYSIENELYINLWDELYKKFKSVKSEYKHLYNLV